MEKRLNNCPVCESNLDITSYHCSSCGTDIEGDFTGCSFCNLSDNDRLFALVIIQTEGNMKQIEDAMGISYPNIKSRLAKLKAALADETPVMPERGMPEPTAEPRKSTKRTARVAFNDLFTLSSNLFPLAKAIQAGIVKVKGIEEQLVHKHHVAWAVRGITGAFKRVGGLWEHSKTLCLQIRWMSQEVLDRAKKMGFVVYGTPLADLKCNMVRITDEKHVKQAVELLEMQAKAIVEGRTGSSNLNT